MVRTSFFLHLLICDLLFLYHSYFLPSADASFCGYFLHHVVINVIMFGIHPVVAAEFVSV